MVEEVFDAVPHAEPDEVNYVEAGKGIGDSGATRSVVGSETWKEWLVKLNELGRLPTVRYERCSRQFRFGNQQVLTATKKVMLPVMVHGVAKDLEAFIVAGRTPMLVGY